MRGGEARSAEIGDGVWRWFVFHPLADELEDGVDDVRYMLISDVHPLKLPDAIAEFIRVMTTIVAAGFEVVLRVVDLGEPFLGFIEIVFGDFFVHESVLQTCLERFVLVLEKRVFLFESGILVLDGLNRRGASVVDFGSGLECFLSIVLC